MHLALLALAVCVPLAQIAALLTTIWRQTPRAPWGDEWNLVLLLQRQDAGTLSFANFWALHNRTHRIVLPRIAELLLVDVSHWNRQVMMTFDLGVAVAAGGLLLACMFSTLRSRRLALTLLIPLSLLYFSFAQYENWFFPWQLTFMATILGICCCLYGFHRSGEADRQGQRAASWQGFALALLGAVIASLSSFGGLCVWPAFLPSAVRAGRVRTGMWVAVALLIGVPYVMGLPHGSLTSPLHLAAFFVAALGAPVASLNLTEARLFGALGLVALGLTLYAASRLAGELRRLEVWVELAACSMLATAVTTLGRASYGNGLALLSRYQEFSQLWWIALAVIGAVVVRRIVMDMRRVGVSCVLPRVLSDPRHVRWVVASSIALLLICTASGLASDVAGARAGGEWLDSMRAQQSCLLQTPSPSATCLQLYILEGQIPLSDQRLVAYLRTHHLALFDH
ncbi:MAG TPA: hypothetical protein VHI51_03600 [Ktedonobacterales bacterium]|nr:hypothetical protein [Ktedonobacterales bacterium]